MVVAHEGFMLNHIGGVVHGGPDLSSDLDLLQCHDQGPDGALTCRPLGKQMPKLHPTTLCLWVNDRAGGAGGGGGRVGWVDAGVLSSFQTLN